MRGGTSKGVFFTLDDLPAAVRTDKNLRDQILLRVIGSPDPYGKQTDGMGGATSSTSKVALIAPSTKPGHDVDYWFGQVAIDRPMIDWSGNCGNLSTAVGPFAIARGLVKAPANGEAVVRIWQANIRKTIVAHVPMQGGEVQELGDFELDGVTFPAAEIRLEFMDPGADGGGEGGAVPLNRGATGMFPTGQVLDVIEVPGMAPMDATLINAGNPTVFVDATALGLTGTELQTDVNSHPALLARCEAIRAHAAVLMGLCVSTSEATALRPHTPKLAFVAAPQPFTTSSGRQVAAAEVDLLARILSMGVLHHAMTGTGAVAIAVACAIPGTVPARLLGAAVGSAIGANVRFGHPSGTLTVGAEAALRNGKWVVAKALMSRSARRLMTGEVWVPILE